MKFSNGHFSDFCDPLRKRKVTVPCEDVDV